MLLEGLPTLNIDIASSSSSLGRRKHKARRLNIGLSITIFQWTTPFLHPLPSYINLVSIQYNHQGRKALGAKTADYSSCGTRCPYGSLLHLDNIFLPRCSRCWVDWEFWGWGWNGSHSKGLPKKVKEHPYTQNLMWILKMNMSLITTFKKQSPFFLNDVFTIHIYNVPLLYVADQASGSWRFLFSC